MMAEASNGKVYDVTIIGGGPTGLFGLFYACLRDMEALIIDSMPELGGQLVALYPEKDVYDVPGFPRIRAKELAQGFIDQAQMHKQQDIVLGEKVQELTRDEASGILTLRGERGTYATRTVVICIGPGAFTPNKLKLPVLEQLEGRSLHYFVRDMSIFRGKRVVIVGGGDSALDWVLNLYPIAKTITLVHRRDQFRAAEDSVAKMMALPEMERLLFCEVKDVVTNDSGELTQVLIENNQTHEQKFVEADVLLLNLGFAADVGPVKGWGLELKGNSILVNQKMETNIPGVFAAGDVALYPGKLKLIATGTAEAAIAVNCAKHLIDPSQREQPVHSTTLFEKKKPPPVPEHSAAGT